MRSIWIARHVISLSVVAVFAVAITPASAQKGGGSPKGNTGGAGSAGPGSVGPTGRSPSYGNPGSLSNPSSSPGGWPSSRPIFFSGSVILDDGSKPNGDIRIERVCNGNARLEGHTDSKGRFSFQVGQNAMADTDIADSMPGGMAGSTSGRGQSVSLWGCELRAAYPGYRSDTVELGHYGSNDSNTDIGTMILHRLGGTPGGTISLSSALVPKNARKAYEKGEQFAEKGKFEEAEKQFDDATGAYPKYALAWFALGQLQQKEGNAKDARKSYQAAVAADGKYAEAYDRLALLSAQGEEWEGTAQYSEQAILLDAIDYPSSLWYNAVANFQLKKPAEAEKSVRELLRMDKAHKYSEAEHLYAELLLSRGDSVGAAAHLRAYLAIAPNSKGAAAAKQALAKLEQAKAEPGTSPEAR